MVQWLRICLAVQGTLVLSLIQEDLTCCGATKPEHHDCRVSAPQLLTLVHLEPVEENPLQ